MRRTRADERRAKLVPFDAAELLDSDEAIAEFMADVFATGDGAFIAHSLGIVARAKGMRQIAEETGLSRESLYRSFSEKGNPSLKNTLAVMKALGIDFPPKSPTVMP
ncbi:MAG: addiction module antidote protein [Janthinobacterium lividum]